jgi:hypothetical protein
MKSKEEVNKNLGKLKEEELKAIEGIVFDLTNFAKEKKITEDSIQTLSNALVALGALKDMITWKLIRLLKQDHMLD